MAVLQVFMRLALGTVESMCPLDRAGSYPRSQKVGWCSACVHISRNHKLSSPRPRLSLDLQCCICLGDFEDGEQLRVLGCKHGFHMDCVDEWLPVRPPSLALCVWFLFPYA